MYLYITSYGIEEEYHETAEFDECVEFKNETKYKIPVQRDIGYIFIQTDLPVYHPNETG